MDQRAVSQLMDQCWWGWGGEWLGYQHSREASGVEVRWSKITTEKHGRVTLTSICSQPGAKKKIQEHKIKSPGFMCVGGGGMG